MQAQLVSKNKDYNPINQLQDQAAYSNRPVLFAGDDTFQFVLYNGHISFSSKDVLYSSFSSSVDAFQDGRGFWLAGLEISVLISRLLKT